MFLAAHKGEAQAVAAWLDGGGGVDARCSEQDDDSTLLIAAAWGGQEAMVRMLLQRGASVNLQDSVGFTALMLAALHCHTTVVQALLDAKADASLQANGGSTALMLAEHNKHTATAQLLRQHVERQTAKAEAREGASAVHAAAAADASAAELLGEEAAEKEAPAKTGKGKKKKVMAAPSTAAAEPAAVAPLASAPKTAVAQEGLPRAVWRAAGDGDMQAITAWLDEGGGVDARSAERQGATLLMRAVMGGEEAMLRMLLQRGASVNLQDFLGITALMGAAVLGHTTIVQVLLDAKADASLRSARGETALGMAEQEKQTAIAQLLRHHAEQQAELPEAMFLAAHRGDAQAVTAWLDEGSDVDACCTEHTGSTLLMVAANREQEVMVRMLLQRGASVNLQDITGGTALMGAAAVGHTTIVQALLDAKADASLQTIDGSTALMAAERFKHTTIAQLLRLHAKSQAPGRLYDLHPVSGTLSGRRVRIGGLKARPELNGRCGAAGRFDAAKGRYEVAVEGEAETVLLKPANLQDGWLQKLLEPAVPALTVTLTLSLP